MRTQSSIDILTEKTGLGPLARPLARAKNNGSLTLEEAADGFLDPMQGRIIFPSPGELMCAYYNAEQMAVEDMNAGKPTVIDAGKFAAVTRSAAATQVTSSSVIRPVAGQQEQRVLLELNVPGVNLGYAFSSIVRDMNLSSGASVISLKSGRWGYDRRDGCIKPYMFDHYNLEQTSFGLNNSVFAFTPKLLYSSGWSKNSQQGGDIPTGVGVTQRFAGGSVEKNMFVGFPDVCYSYDASIQYAAVVANLPSGDVPSMVITVGGYQPFTFLGGPTAQLVSDIAASPLAGVLVVGAGAIGAGTTLSVVTGEPFSIVGESINAATISHKAYDEVIRAGLTHVGSLGADVAITPIGPRWFTIEDSSGNHRFTIEAITPLSLTGLHIMNEIASRLADADDASYRNFLSAL